MDGVVDIGIFLAATFVAALVAGLAGSAFGLVASAIWLHVLTPLQTASLIIGFGLIVQGMAVWKLRRALNWMRLPVLLARTWLGLSLYGRLDEGNFRKVMLILLLVAGTALVIPAR